MKKAKNLVHFHSYFIMFLAAREPLDYKQIVSITIPYQHLIRI